jgi:phosphoribosylaminoimidazolecarboxamide formyltransferase/IMP cyclohydrolase
MIKRALISVSDKTGIADFARELDKLGVQIISTGGTAALLEKEGMHVTGISDITHFPECLDGRVKTLHPAVHGALLARRDVPSHMKQLEQLNIKTIDLIVVNLYPFKQTILKEGAGFEEVIENIDIGGPTMLRSAAKNFRDVTVVTDPADYETVLKAIKDKGDVDYDTKMYLAQKVFSATSYYDTLIAGYFKAYRKDDSFGETATFAYDKAMDLRYGENPHQRAAFYKEIINTRGTLAACEQLWGRSCLTTTSTIRTARLKF